MVRNEILDRRDARPRVEASALKKFIYFYFKEKLWFEFRECPFGRYLWDFQNASNVVGFLDLYRSLLSASCLLSLILISFNVACKKRTFSFAISKMLYWWLYLTVVYVQLYNSNMTEFQKFTVWSRDRPATAPFPSDSARC